MDPMDEDARSSSGRLGSESAPSVSASGAAQANTPTSGFGNSNSTHGTHGTTHAAQVNKRRRGLGVVTPNACTECRKKRAKCDGQKPCSRCRSQKDVECVYEIPVRQSKEDLRSEIDHLRRQQRSSESIFAALSRSEHWEEILQRLRSGQSIENISGWLTGDVSSEHGGTGSPLPSFGRTANALGPNLTPLATFVGGGSGSYTPLSSSLGRASPSSAQAQAMRHELDSQQRQGSPWNSHFPHGQPLSARPKPYPDAIGWPSGSPAPIGSWEGQSPPGGPSYRGGLLVVPEVPDLKVSANTWTNITDDSSLVQHLLALYFCWEYPTFASLSKEHFLRDMEDGRNRFCSSILINALLALGCRFSSQPNTRADPNNPYTSGDHFFKESQRLFYAEEDHHTLTTIQALGIMSIREASCGRDSESWYYAGQSIRLAIEMGLHTIQDEGGDEDEMAVKAATFWGAFALDHAWSLATGSLPQCSCFPHLPPKPGIIDDIEASLWIPYTDDGAPLQRSCEQPSNVRSVYKCFCELSELVHQSLYILHSPGRPLTSRDLLNIYTQYLNWYDRIPEVLRLGHNFTPAVLFAHMYYHFAILLLFRPLIKLRIIGSSIIPKDVCAQAADAIHGLLRSYSQLYTLRRTPSFVPYFVLTSSIMHLAIGAVTAEEAAADDAQSPRGAPHHDPSVEEPKLNPRVVESVNRGIADLTEMAPCHQFAEQALSILRYLAKSWGIEVNIPTSARGYDGHPLDLDQSVRPTTSSLNFFAPNVTETDFNCVWAAKAPSGPSQPDATTEQKITEKSAETMENPLFWPFPMQGRPMLPTGKLLEEAGFLLLNGTS